MFIAGFILLALVVKFWFVVVPVTGAIVILAVASGTAKKRQALRKEAASARKKLASEGVFNPSDDLRNYPDKEVIKILWNAKNYRDLFVFFPVSTRAWSLTSRTKNAVAAILASPEYKAGTCGVIPPGALLQNQWEIAMSLRDYTERCAELPAGSTGPITAPVIAAQRQATEIAATAIVKRIMALEAYAAEVAKCDAARRDWTAAQKASAANGKYADLVARTAAADLATADIRKDSDYTAKAAKILGETLASAALAAEVLAL